MSFLLQSRWHQFLAFVVTLAALIPLPVHAQISGAGTAPFYPSQSIVNGATQTAEALAPNAIATLYGTNLAFSTRAVAATDIVGGVMPTTLDGVAVWVNAIPCSLFLISPTQINFLVPYELTAGTVSVIVARDSQAGPSVSIQLNATSPGLFMWNGNNAVAAHLSGQVISPTSPAVPGRDYRCIYRGDGLGRTSPDAAAGQLATGGISDLFPFSVAGSIQRFALSTR